MDFCGNNDGTLYGLTTDVTSGNGFNDNEAFEFDGSGDWVNTTKETLSGTTSFSVSFWMYPTNLPGDSKERLIVKDRDGSSGQFLVRWDGTNNKGVQFLLRDSADSTWEEVNMGGNKLNTNELVHISAVWNRSGQTAKLYVNGSENASSSISFSDTKEVSWPIAIGGDSEGGDFENYQGKIDEPRLHTKALNSSEVDNLYSNNHLSGGGGDDGSASPTFSGEDPADGTTGVNDTDDSTGIDVNTSIVVQDADNSTLNSVSLCWGNGTCYYTESNVANDSRVSYMLEDLKEETTYDWQAQADDGSGNTTSSTYSFTTAASSSVSKNCTLGYHYNETSGPSTDICDGNDAVWNGDIQSVTGVDFNDKKALDFDGNGDYQNTTKNNFPGDENFTVATWVNGNNLDNTNQRFISKDKAGTPGQFLFWWYGDSDRAFELAVRNQADDTWGRVSAGTNSDYSNDKWYHVVAVWNRVDQNLSIWVNGSMKASNTVSFDTMKTNSLPITIASDSDGGDDELDATLDEPRLYDKPLTENEIQNLYENNTIVGSATSPDPISLSSPYPADGGKYAPLSLNFSIDYTHADGVQGNVSTFWSNDTEIYSENNVAAGSTVETGILDLEERTTYKWFANATESDGGNSSQTGTFTFTTDYADNGTLVVNDTVQDPTYLDEAHDVELRVEEDGTYAYVVGRDSSFGVVNITDPDAMQVTDGVSDASIGKANTVYPFPKYDIAYAFGGSDVKVMNVSDKSDVTMKRSFGSTNLGQVNGLAEFNYSGSRYMLTASKKGYVCRINITDPTNENVDGCSSDGGVVPSPHDMYLLNGTDYAVVPSNDDNNADAELATFRWKDGTGLIAPSNYNAASSLKTKRLYKANRVFSNAASDITYVASDDIEGSGEVSHMVVVNTSDPTSISQITYKNTTGNFSAGLELVNDEMLYVGSGNWGEVFNVSDPTDPVHRDAVTDPVFDGEGNPVGSSAHDLEIHDGTLFLTAGQVDADALVSFSDVNYDATGSGGNNSAPSISNLAASPDPVNTGNTVNITADITDSDNNLDRQTCVLKDADGNVEANNVSMSRSGDTYWCERTITENDVNGNWTAEIYANDTAGASSSDSTKFTVNTGKPPITIHSPGNTSYRVDTVDLKVSSKESIDTWQYNLDGGTNTTFTPNTTITGLADGTHTVTVYANDSLGQTNRTSRQFTINQLPIPSDVRYDGFEHNNLSKNYENNTEGTWNPVYEIDSGASKFGSYGLQGNAASGTEHPPLYRSMDEYTPEAFETYLWIRSLDAKERGWTRWRYNNETVISVRLASQDSGNDIRVNGQTVVSGIEHRTFYKVTLQNIDYTTSPPTFDVYVNDKRVAESVAFKKDTAYIDQLQFDLWSDSNINNLVNYDNATINYSRYKPQITGANVSWTGIGGAGSKDVSVSVLDKADNLNSHTSPPSGTVDTFSNSTLDVSGWSAPFDWSASVSDADGLSSYSRNINFSTSDTGLQVHDYANDLSTQRLNRTVTLNVRGDSVNHTLTFNDEGTVVQDGTSSGELSSGTEKTVTEIWEGDWINETEHGFAPQKDEITLGIDYIGDRNLELANLKAVSWTDIDTTSGVTTPDGCSQTNNTAVDIGASATQNYTIEMKCDPGSVAADLTQITDADADNDTWYWYNSTSLNVTTNYTKDRTIIHKIPESELNDWDIRKAGTEEIYCNGKKVANATVEDPADTVRVNYWPNSSCGSSLTTATTSIGFKYEVGESDTTIIKEESSSSSSGSQGDGDLGAELLPSQPYRVGFGVNVTKTLRVRNYKNVENRVDLAFVPRPEDACQYFRIQEVTKGSVMDSGRISVDHTGGFGDSGLVRIPPASKGSLTGSSSEIPVPMQMQMPDEETFNRVKTENGTISCRVQATVTNGVVNDVIIEVKPQTNPFTGMFVSANQFLAALIDALLNTFSTTQQTCFGENNTALLTNGTEQCPDSAQQTKRMPTRAGWGVLIITVISIAGIAAYRYR